MVNIIIKMLIIKEFIKKMSLNPKASKKGQLLTVINLILKSSNPNIFFYSNNLEYLEQSWQNFIILSLLKVDEIKELIIKFAISIDDLNFHFIYYFLCFCFFEYGINNQCQLLLSNFLFFLGEGQILKTLLFIGILVNQCNSFFQNLKSIAILWNNSFLIILLSMLFYYYLYYYYQYNYYFLFELQYLKNSNQVLIALLAHFPSFHLVLF